MNPTWQRIVSSKKAAREKLAALPWPEKLRRLDAMMERSKRLREMEIHPSQNSCNAKASCYPAE